MTFVDLHGNYSNICWAQVFRAFFRELLLDDQDSYVLAGNACVVFKASKRTVWITFLQLDAASRTRFVIFRTGLDQQPTTTILS